MGWLNKLGTVAENNLALDRKNTTQGTALGTHCRRRDLGHTQKASENFI